MSHHLRRPVQGLFNPVFALVLPIVAAVEPDVTQSREPGVDIVSQKWIDAIAVHDVGRMDGRPEDEPFGID